ncbi:HCP-like protein [Rhizoctonia solani]|uniref:HCP-like protein n=1 Tax=Rhizoctonia solani TaxID=456999 RepID=A0A8H7IM74_9AGAM|nr:HCP-like protein [Rhizoctonia solani]
MPAPRPQKIMSNVPSDMAQNLEQGMHTPSSFSMPVPSFAGGFSAPPPPPQGVSYGFRALPNVPQHPGPPAYPGPGGFAQHPHAPPVPHHQSSLSITQSFDAMSIGPQPGFSPRQSSLMGPPTPRPLSFAANIPPPATPLPQPPAPATSPVPTFAEPAAGPGQPPAIVTPMPTVSTLLAAESKLTKPPSNPEPISDPVVARLANVAIQHVLSFASVWQVGSRDPVPPHVAEALYLRGTLEASGAFPEKIPRDQRSAFRDFNEAARQGYKAGWFKIGRDYESVKDMARAREVFERGAGLKETSCLYRLGMAHLLGQLGFTANPAVAVPLLQEAADLANVDVPQPAYVFGMLLLGEFAQARRRIERAAFLGYGPALYKMGWGYEHAKMGCAYDPLLSVQYYSSASQRGEAEADMSLSKWFLCGSEGFFEKDENLAVVFAEKAPTGSWLLECSRWVIIMKSELASKLIGTKLSSGIKSYGPSYRSLCSQRSTAFARRARDPYRSRLVRRHTKAKDTAAAAGRVAQAKGEEDRKAMEGAAHAAADSDVGQPARRPGQLPLPGSDGGVKTPPRVTSPAQAQMASPKRRPQPQGQVAGRFQQRYTLTDEGFQTPSSPQVINTGPCICGPCICPAAPALAPALAPPSPTTPAATKLSGKKGPQSFAEMGFHSQPVEDKDCVIM